MEVEERHWWDADKNRIFRPDPANSALHFENGGSNCPFFGKLPSGNFIYIQNGHLENAENPFGLLEDTGIHLFLVSPSGDVLDSRFLGSGWEGGNHGWPKQLPIGIPRFGYFSAESFVDGVLMVAFGGDPDGDAAFMFCYIWESSGAVEISITYDKQVPWEDLSYPNPQISDSPIWTDGTEALVLLQAINQQDRFFYTVSYVSNTELTVVGKGGLKSIVSGFTDLDVSSRYVNGGIWKFGSQCLLAFDAKDNVTNMRHLRVSLINLDTGTEEDFFKILTYEDRWYSAGETRPAIASPITAWMTDDSFANGIYRADDGTFACMFGYYPSYLAGEETWFGRVQIARILFSVNGSSLSPPTEVGDADIELLPYIIFGTAREQWGYFPYCLPPWQDGENYYLPINSQDTPTYAFRRSDHELVSMFTQVDTSALSAWYDESDPSHSSENYTVLVRPLVAEPGSISVSAVLVYQPQAAEPAYLESTYVIAPKIHEERIDGKRRSRRLAFKDV